MNPLLAGLLSGGSSLIGSIFSSNTSAQNTQAQIAGQEQMLTQSEDFNAGQAQIQRDYQTQMSNTAYQRAAQDAKAAGLNPMILANGGGMSSTPSGSSASVGTPSVPMPQTKSVLGDIGDVVNKTVNTAIAAKTYDKMTDEIANLQAQEARTAAETSLTKQRTETEKEDTFRSSQQNTLLGMAMPGARFSAKQAEDLLNMPDWLRSAATQGGFVGDKASKAIEPISDLISSASGVRRLLQFPDNPSKTFSGPSDRQKMKDNFNELWESRAH